MSVFHAGQLPSPAVFLGAGIHTSLGADIASNLAALQKPAAAPVVYSNRSTTEEQTIPYKFLVDAPVQEPEYRLYRIVSAVAEQAIKEAQLSDGARQEMGLFIGSSSFDISAMEALFKKELAQKAIAEQALAQTASAQQPLALRDPSFSKLADTIGEALGIRGPDVSINTACTASANALVMAVEQVESGVLEHALVIGVELHNDISALGFYGLGLLTCSVMKPFDQVRDGLVLGEGVSALVVGRDPKDGQARFFLRGSANLCDTHSISAAAPDGSSIKCVMEKALLDARLAASEISAIKAHGTASLSNDEAESAGMHQLFPTLPPVCALKPYLGHTLGACGLNELVLFYRALEAGFLIANPGISAESGELNVFLNQEYRALAPGNFMLNYFGFGGNNSSLIISNSAGVK